VILVTKFIRIHTTSKTRVAPYSIWVLGHFDLGRLAWEHFDPGASWPNTHGSCA